MPVKRSQNSGYFRKEVLELTVIDRKAIQGPTGGWKFLLFDLVTGCMVDTYLKIHVRVHFELSHIAYFHAYVKHSLNKDFPGSPVA